ncbi:MAG: hypothetical protein ACQERJ_05070 [Bacillota bacterium]
MTRLLFSVRITEKYFSVAEIERLEQELKSFNSKSDFMRKMIRFYLEHNNSDLEVKSGLINKIKEEHPKGLRSLLEENNSLLKEIVTGRGIRQTSQLRTTVYQGQEQEDKTNQALSLLDNF